MPLATLPMGLPGALSGALSGVPAVKSSYYPPTNMLLDFVDFVDLTAFFLAGATAFLAFSPTFLTALTAPFATSFTAFTILPNKPTSFLAAVALTAGFLVAGFAGFVGFEADLAVGLAVGLAAEDFFLVAPPEVKNLSDLTCVSMFYNILEYLNLVREKANFNLISV
jgi:hypothetical protein